MHIFDSSAPIAVDLDIGVCNIEISASDRTDTRVEVTPSDPSKDSDVRAVEQTRVHFENGKLTVVRNWKYSFRKSPESVDVHIDLPSGSKIHGTVGVATLRCQGLLGECHFKVGLGDIRIEQADTVSLKTGSGNVYVDHVLGSGDSFVRNANGDTWIGEVTGELLVHAANGKIDVEHARAGVTLKTANGDVRVGEVERGSIVVQSAFGKLDIGVRDGAAAWLDLVTGFGNVRSELETAEGPRQGEKAVEVRARTSCGDVTIHRQLAPCEVGAT